MEKVVVTEEMRCRILRAIRSTDLTPKPKEIRFTQWRRYLAAAACAAVLLLGALTVPGILHRSQENPAVGAADGNVPAAGAPETVEYASAAELSEQIGFPVSDLTVLPFKPTGAVYSSSFGELAEIDYTGADGQSAVYRKSPGTDDNSGNYEAFTDTEQLSAGSVQAAVKGDGTQFTLAVWTDGTYAYSISLSKGVELGEWSDILKGLS